MDIYRDEVRRQVEASQREHDLALPRFERALDRALDPDDGANEQDKMRLLGLPDRRGFLRIGGVAFAASAIMGACVNQREKGGIAVTGTLPQTTTTSEPVFEGSAAMDATLVLTALSIEYLAVGTYGAALDNSWIKTAGVLTAATVFEGQHKQHALSLASIAGRLGQSPSSDPNAFLQKKVVDPAVEKIKELFDSGDEVGTEAAALRLALDLEDMAAQTYTKAGGILTTPDLRQAIMSIGAIEARHYSVLAGVLKEPQVPFAFEHTGSAAPEDAYVRPAQDVVPATTSSRPAAGTSSTTR